MRQFHQESIAQEYKHAIGHKRGELITPALILDLDVARRNIQFMAERLGSLGVNLRPHIKAHKCPELARRQIQAGAIGICTATVWEAIVMSRAGIEDVYIANEVCGREKISALAREAGRGHLGVAVDDPGNATDLSDALCSAGSTLDVLIEVDVGMGRGGVRSPQEAVELARCVSRLPGLRLRGIQAYEGHCMLESDRAIRMRKAAEAMDLAAKALEQLTSAGFPCDVVSAGGTGTYDITGADKRVTEIQAGSYILMDNFHGGLVPGFSRSLTVLATVVIQHGSTIVLDAGLKSIGVDEALPTMVPYPFYRAEFHEEHALFSIDDRSALRRGDTVELIPGYAPTTVNLYDAFHVVEDGIVTDIWPIAPRGPGHAGLL
jgi:D-serine deaminase-like pyridoxal phosphate-dependent protein